MAVKRKKIDGRPLLSPREAAERLGLDKVSKEPIRRLWNLARLGQIVKVKVGRFNMYRPESIDRYLGHGA